MALSIPPSAPGLYTEPPGFSLGCTELVRWRWGASALGQEENLFHRFLSSCLEATSQDPWNLGHL